MNNKRIYSADLYFFFLIIICCISFSFVTKHEKESTISIWNLSLIKRNDELIVLKRADIEKKVGKIPVDKFISLTNKSTAIDIQFDDLNDDGIWDELAFLYSFEPKEKIQLSIAVTDKPSAIKVIRAHVRQKHKNPNNSFGSSFLKDTMPFQNAPTDFSKQILPPFLTEGPAWENDKVGFRIYFDTRNTKDIWGKTTEKMVLDFVGADPKNVYHHLDWWGMDIYAVGKSLGAGSLALRVKLPDGSDSLVRLGGKNIEQVTYKQIADGPLRAVFELQYKGWTIADNLPKVDVTEQISIWGGHFFYESKVTVQNAPAGSSLVIGYANIKSSSQDYSFDSLNGKALYSYDIQSENTDNLGLGIVVKQTANIKTGRTVNQGSEVLNTSYVQIPLNNKQPIKFRFVSGWEKSTPCFKSREGFLKYIKEETNAFLQPIEVLY